ncbi:MAG: phosphatidate cytidylyltransferase [Candidatus Kapaibacteriota bacterium]
MNELMKRILVAVIGIPFAIAILYLGGWYFFITIAVISSIGLIEFYKLAEKKDLRIFYIVPIIFLLIFEYLVFNMIYFKDLGNSLQNINIIIILSLFSFLILLTINLFYSKKNQLLTISVLFTGLIYILVPFSSLIIIRLMNYSKAIVLETDISKASFILIYFSSIWLCDSAAYFIGKKWGKHKIAPQISPKKSYEGGIAGLITSVVFFPILSKLFNLNLDIEYSLLFGAMIGLFGQVGDFVESSFKRDVGVKDSSNILSEHGGILDRFDSIMFTAPIILLILLLINQ